jgi:hypothetical protein
VISVKLRKSKEINIDVFRYRMNTSDLGSFITQKPLFIKKRNISQNQLVDDITKYESFHNNKYSLYISIFYSAVRDQTVSGFTSNYSHYSIFFLKKEYFRIIVK